MNNTQPNTPNSHALVESIGRNWNAFWFQRHPACDPMGPASPLGPGWNLVLLRQFVGLFAFGWLLNLSGHLIPAFGATGWLSREVVHQSMVGGDPTKIVPGFSPFFLFDSPAMLWSLHGVALLCAALLAVGYKPRLLSWLTLLCVLSYVHRAPLLTGPFETLLCMLLLYVSLMGDASNFTARIRTKRSGDRHDRKRAQEPAPARAKASDLDGWSHLAVRLIQVHLCGIYLLIAATKLANPVWWTGDAVWYLISDKQHRLLDLTGILTSTYLMNALTHAWLAFEIVFPVLIWHASLRRTLLSISTLIWLATSMVSGDVGYCLLMCAANLAFLDQALQSHAQCHQHS